MITITNDDPRLPAGYATYQCAICHENYSTATAAKECESRPMSGEKGVFPPDTVLITKGGGTGKLAEVFARGIAPSVWSDRLWHTVLLRAIIRGGGVRTLDMDSYDRVGPGHYDRVSEWTEIAAPAPKAKKMEKTK
ncbi:MAG TPA: hypothetical protein VMV98_08105 [Acidobacteriaceae bacterium]|nr:hypothetical protein [Acidobacteriaceae bacterium]